MALGQVKTAKTVGRYEIGPEVASSYLGSLYSVHADSGDGATELGLLRLVSLSRLDAETRVRLLEAAWQAMEVRHDRILSVLDVVASDGELGIVSAGVTGQTLRALLSISTVRRKPIPAPVAFRIIFDLLDALSALHRASAEFGEESVPLFGGLSPDSVLVGMNGQTSLLDVSIASAACSVEALGGSPDRVAYAAPEQIASPPAADARTDVFSLGVLAWELLSNRRLFLGSDKAVAQKVLAAKIPKLGDVKRADAVPPAALAVVMTALEREPAARHASIDEMASRLKAALTDVADFAGVAEYLESLKDAAPRKSAEAQAKESPVRVSLGSRVQAKRPELPRLPVQTAPPAAPPTAAPKDASPKKPTIGGKPAGVRRATIIGVAPAPKTANTAFVAPKPSAEATTQKRLVRPTPRVGSDPELAPAHAPRVGSDPDAARPAPVVVPAAQAVTPRAVPATIAAADSPSSPSRRAPEAVISPRARQPTMIGIAPPSLPSLPTQDTLPDIEAEVGASSDDEPTLQYTARELLQHVEAVKRSTATPEPIERLEISTAPPPPRKIEPAEDGGWLDGPEEPMALSMREPLDVDSRDLLPAFAQVVSPRPSDAGALVQRSAPERSVPPHAVERPRAEPFQFSPTAPAARNLSVERARQAAAADPGFAPPRSVPPPAVLPSQVPPPLIHDPRANRATSMPPPAVPATDRSMRGMLLGGAASLVIVTISAVIGIYVLRARTANETTPSLTARTNAVLAPEKPMAPPADPAPVATAAVVPAVTAAPAPAPEAPSAAAPADSAAQRADDAEPSAAEAPQTQPSVAAHLPAARTAKAAAPAPGRATRSSAASRRTSKKKNSRYVPDDI